jgi:hypothetical protein
MFLHGYILLHNYACEITWFILTFNKSLLMTLLLVFSHIKRFFSHCKKINATIYYVDSRIVSLCSTKGHILALVLLTLM